jgi:hypothetical protein
LSDLDPDIAIPYWNSTADFKTTDPLFWANDFLKEFDLAWGLGRVLGRGTLPDPARVQEALNKGSYSEFWPFLETVVHNSPHNWVEGLMRTGRSPADPVFYLHHCWIDMIWAQWQLLHPGATFESSGPGFSLTDPLVGWTTTPADVLDHRTINIYDYPPGWVPD